MKVFKILEIIFGLFIVFSLCAACCLEVPIDSPIFFAIYGTIILMMVVGGLGWQFCQHPYYYLGIAYAAIYSIVNNIRILFVHNRAAYAFRENRLLDRYYIFYDEGIERYDSKHCIY